MHGKVLGMRETPNGKTVPRGVRFWEANFVDISRTSRKSRRSFSVVVNEIVAKHYARVYSPRPMKAAK